MPKPPQIISLGTFKFMGEFRREQYHRNGDPILASEDTAEEISEAKDPGADKLQVLLRRRDEVSNSYASNKEKDAELKKLGEEITALLLEK